MLPCLTLLLSWKGVDKQLSNFTCIIWCAYKTRLLLFWKACFAHVLNGSRGEMPEKHLETLSWKTAMDHEGSEA